MLLHEIMAGALALGLCIWLLLGDFEKAFPKTWGNDLLSLVGSIGGVTGGAFASLCGTFAWDEVAVFLSGASSTMREVL